MSLGKNIKALRKKHKLKQTELAEIIGVKNGPSVSNWESDRIHPPLTTLTALADYFDVSLDLLLNGDPKDFETHNFYGVSDYGKEARKIFQVLAPDEQDDLLRRMYEYKIRHDRKNRTETSFTQLQLAAILLSSTTIVLQEFGRHIQKIFTTHDEIHDVSLKQLLKDTTMYLSDGKEHSNEFETLLRMITEKLFPLSFFEFAYEKDNLTIEKMSQQFQLESEFIKQAFTYYVQVKGPTFTYKNLSINLSPVIKASEQMQYLTTIEIKALIET